MASYIFPESLFQKTKDKAMFIRIAQLNILTSMDDLAAVAEKLKNDATSEASGAMELLSSGLQPGDMSSTRYQDTKYLHWIGLPLPNQLNETYGHQWTQQTSILSDIANSLVPDKLSKAYSNLSDSQSLAKAVINPGFFQEYASTSPRTFDFTYDLMPNTQEEAQKIEEIILLLKAYSAPHRTSTTAILTAPNFFEISFCNLTLDNIIRPRPCVLTNITINYGPSGFVETTGDGRPKAITLNLTFAEKEAMMFGDWAVAREQVSPGA